MFYYFSGNEETLASGVQKAGEHVARSGMSPNAPLGGGLNGNGRGYMEP
jgi:hypothetical protein